MRYMSSKITSIIFKYNAITSHCWPFMKINRQRPSDFLRKGPVMLSVMASQITSLTTIYLTVYTRVDQRKHQSSASLAFVRGMHRWTHKGPVTRKMFLFDDVIMNWHRVENDCCCPRTVNISNVDFSLKISISPEPVFRVHGTENVRSW